MDSKIKISQLTAETQLSPAHLFVVQDGSVNESETKKASLSLLKNWLGGLNFENLTKIFKPGEDISIEIDEESQIIKINSTTIATQWFAGEQPSEAKDGDFWLDAQGKIYRYTGGSWISADVSLKGPQGTNGQDGFSPIITVIQNSKGYTLKIQDKLQEQSIEIINGLVPYIDEETLCWVIGDVNTGIPAQGKSPAARVEETENGYSIVVNDGEESRVDINTPTIEFGTIEMLPAGQTPIVENVGNNINAILNLKIPKGVDGGGSVVIQGPYIINTTDWTDDKRQFIAIPLELTNRNVIDIDYESLDIWATCQIRPFQETTEGIWFKCTIKPTVELKFYITSMGVSE